MQGISVTLITNEKEYEGITGSKGLYKQVLITGLTPRIVVCRVSGIAGAATNKEGIKEKLSLPVN